jgi:hypothetical protein
LFGSRNGIPVFAIRSSPLSGAKKVFVAHTWVRSPDGGDCFTFVVVFERKPMLPLLKRVVFSKGAQEFSFFVFAGRVTGFARRFPAKWACH